MIDKEQVRHIAKLARIQLADPEVEQYQKDLSEILDYFDILKEVDTSLVEPMTHSVLQENIAREDMRKKERPELVQHLFGLAPAVKNGFVKVRSVFSNL
tara:strand:- start:2599 stop:2895 length:297 start_codon:yes stop_codon:yes gene_type:complete